MVDKEIRYVHNETIHNCTAAEQVVPVIIDLLNPKSVIDVGCGIGTWLKVFKDNGVSRILGIDGSYVDKSLFKISNEIFIEHELEKSFSINERFDIALSLEVAEHLKEESASVFVKSLTRLSDVVVFSAAIKHQGGQNHINEQSPGYWISKFQSEGYTCLDILRPMFWNNEKVECWYRQNMFLFTNDSSLISRFKNKESFLNQNLIHPKLLQIRDNGHSYCANENKRILEGRKGLKFYINLLIVALKFKFFRSK